MCENKAPYAAVILDMDGVLCENTFRREYGTDRDYELFARRCPYAVANMDFICMARALKMDGVAVFVLTARSEKLRQKTLIWLKEKGLSVDRLLMRPKGDRSQDHLLKKKMLQTLNRECGLLKPGGITPLMAVDDDVDVVKMYKNAGIAAYLPPDVPEVLV